MRYVSMVPVRVYLIKYREGIKRKEEEEKEY